MRSFVVACVLACASSARADCPGRTPGAWLEIGDKAGAPDLRRQQHMSYLTPERLFLWSLGGSDSAVYDLCKGTWAAIASPPQQAFGGYEKPVVADRYFVWITQQGAV